MRTPSQASLLLASALSLSGCSAAQWHTAEAVGEALCEAFLPALMPTGASLVCKGLETSIASAVTAATAAPPPPVSPSLFGGGSASEPERRVPRHLRVGGKVGAVVPLTREEAERAQRELDKVSP